MPDGPKCAPVLVDRRFGLVDVPRRWELVVEVVLIFACLQAVPSGVEGVGSAGHSCLAAQLAQYAEVLCCEAAGTVQLQQQAQ